MERKPCPSCGFAVSNKSTYCPKCGVRLPRMSGGLIATFIVAGVIVVAIIAAVVLHRIYS